MSGFETAIRGGLRLKRHSEALAADEKRRRKRKRARESKEEDAGPTAVHIPPELTGDSRAVAAAAAIEAGEHPSEALRAKDRETTGTQSDPDTGSAIVSTPESERTGERDTTDRRSASVEQTRPQESNDVEALLSETNPHWTQAERAFFLARKAREAERIKKQLQLTHRQRMEKFNQHLASLSEHFDQPRVGPG